MPIFRDYLRSLREIRGSGQAVPETSCYGTLETFLNELGKNLKPRVRSVINLKNRGAGIPDGGLFTEEQLSVKADDPLAAGQLPTRGVRVGATWVTATRPCRGRAKPRSATIPRRSWRDSRRARLLSA